MFSEECGDYYGTGQQRPMATTAICERAPGHPPVSTDGIGHWGEGDERFTGHPDRGGKPTGVKQRTPKVHIKSATGTLNRALSDLSNIPELAEDKELVKALSKLVAQVCGLVNALDGDCDAAQRSREAADSLDRAIGEWAHETNN